MSVATREVQVLGSRVSLLSVEEAVFQLEAWIAERGGRCRQVVVTGFHGLWEAHQDAEFFRIVNEAALWVPDGIAPVLVARARGIRGVRRVPGAELMEAFLAKADFAGYRSFFFGDTEETLARLAVTVGERYLGHTVAGMLSPPFRPLTPEEDAEHIRQINAARPDVLWVGLGTPKQDRWIAAHLDRLEVPVAVAVGAAFRFLTGQVPRAPALVGRLGLEWAYRLAMEPRKLWRRALVQGPQFTAHVLLELTGLRRYGPEPAEPSGRPSAEGGRGPDHGG